MFGKHAYWVDEEGQLAPKPLFNQINYIVSYEGEDADTMISNQVADLTKDEEITQLRASLKEMLAAYWGAGDGRSPPPAFIVRAIKVVKGIAL